MTVAWYCFFHRAAPAGGLSDAERKKVVEAVGGSPRLRTGYVHTPSPAPHPHAGADVAPMLALELEFSDAADCEAALRQAGGLRRLADPGFVPGLAGTTVSQQGMLRRLYAVPDPARARGRRPLLLPRPLPRPGGGRAGLARPLHEPAMRR